MKRPYDVIIETYAENLDKLRENQRLNFSNLDQFIIWITGFSIAGITLIAGNLSQFHDAVTPAGAKVIIMLLAVSIVTAIIYRLALFY